MVLEKTLESPLDSKEIQSVHPKGNQPWIFIGRTDAEAETPVLWPPDGKIGLTWKDPYVAKDWRREEGMTGLDGWMALPIQGTWVWISSWSWWWTGKPGVLQSMGLKRVGHDWVTELNYSIIPSRSDFIFFFFFWLSNILFFVCVCLYTYQIFFIHSSIEGSGVSQTWCWSADEWTGSWGSWLKHPQCLSAAVGLLVGEVVSQSSWG